MLVEHHTTGAFSGQPLNDTQEMLAGAPNEAETSYFLVSAVLAIVCLSQVFTVQPFCVSNRTHPGSMLSNVLAWSTMSWRNRPAAGWPETQVGCCGSLPVAKTNPWS